MKKKGQALWRERDLDFFFFPTQSTDFFLYVGSELALDMSLPPFVVEHIQVLFLHGREARIKGKDS